MLLSRAARTTVRGLSNTSKSSQHCLHNPSTPEFRMHASSPNPLNSYFSPPSVYRSHKRAAGAVGVIFLSSIIYQAWKMHDAFAEASAAPADQADLQFEKIKRKKSGMTEKDKWDMVSSQYLQVRKSWENPGLYAWVSNTGKVGAPDSDETYIKISGRIHFFNDMLLRYLKLNRMFGTAITEKRDLLQWGKG